MNNPDTVCIVPTMDWRERIRAEMKARSVTQDDIATKLQVTRGSVGHKLSGRRGFSPSELRQVAELLGLNYHRLMDEVAGSEPGTTELAEIADIIHRPNELGHVVVGNGTLADMVYVPAVLGARLSAGTGEYVYEIDEEVNAVAFRQNWMVSKGLRPERCKVWKVRGDSMEPRYSHGDSLLIDMSDRTPRHGKNFALVGEDGIRVKQLRAMAGGGWEMYSLNPDKSRYPTEPIVNDNYAIIGRVRGRSGDED